MTYGFGNFYLSQGDRKVEFMRVAEGNTNREAELASLEPKVDNSFEGLSQRPNSTSKPSPSQFHSLPQQYQQPGNEC